MHSIWKEANEEIKREQDANPSANAELFPISIPDPSYNPDDDEEEKKAKHDEEEEKEEEKRNGHDTTLLELDECWMEIRSFPNQSIKQSSNQRIPAANDAVLV